MKRIGLWTGFIAVIALLVWAVISSVNTSGPAGTLSIPVSEADWAKGATSSRAVLVEYSDFQCPACASYEPMIKQLRADFAADLMFVYRHFPLLMHRNADIASGAAEAAGKQGKFWEMHDILFEKQSEWQGAEKALTLFSQYAESLGLDVNKFAEDAVSDEVRKKVNEQYKGGIQSGVQGTPTFFLNGKLITPKSEAQFRQIIQDVLATSTVSQ